MNQLNSLPQVIRMQPRPDVPGAASVIDLMPRGVTGGPESRELVRAVRALDQPRCRCWSAGPPPNWSTTRSSLARAAAVRRLVLLLVTACCCSC